MNSSSWIESLNIGRLFKWYLSGLAALGYALENHNGNAAHVQFPLHNAVFHEALTAGEASSLEDVDRTATAAGNHYRALGISIGLLGIVIVLLAIAPVGLDLEPHTSYLLGGLKVGLMVLMLLIVVLGRRSHTRRRWIDLRAHAEELRYRPLVALIKRADAEPEHAPTLDALEQNLLDVLDGPQGQIAYNASKARLYHAVEHFSDVLLWASVILALFGAVGHLLLHREWWIFFTAFGPAAVGGVHGINGFLNISGLMEDHHAMEQSLAKSLTNVKELRASPTRAHDLPALAAYVLGTLTSRDVSWVKSAGKRNLVPA